MTIYLAELTSEQAAALFAEDPVVVIPIGATEQHGRHLPLETDWKLSSIVAERAAQRVADEGVPICLTPPLWAGFSPHHMDFVGTITLESDTFLRVVSDVSRSLWRHGARKILLLNGHGGNTNLLRATVQRLRFEYDVRVATANYWDFALPFLATWRLSDPGGIDHAGEMETSLMLAVRRALVHPELFRDGTWFPRSKFLSGDLLSGAPVSIASRLSELDAEGLAGNSALGDGERGEELLTEIVSRLTIFLLEFRQWDWLDPRSI